MDSNEKAFGILAYLGWLVLVPIFAGKTEFSRFHANQGLVLAIAEIVVTIVAVIMMFIPIVGWIIGILLYLVDLVALVFAIMGIVNAAQGQMKPLPIIGNIKILK